MNSQHTYLAPGVPTFVEMWGGSIVFKFSLTRRLKQECYIALSHGHDVHLSCEYCVLRQFRVRGRLVFCPLGYHTQFLIYCIILSFGNTVRCPLINLKPLVKAAPFDI
jgi:hypothetical protein